MSESPYPKLPLVNITERHALDLITTMEELAEFFSSLIELKATSISTMKRDVIISKLSTISAQTAHIAKNIRTS